MVRLDVTMRSTLKGGSIYDLWFSCSMYLLVLSENRRRPSLGTREPPSLLLLASSLVEVGRGE